MVLAEPVDRRSDLDFFRRGAGVAGIIHSNGFRPCLDQNMGRSRVCFLSIDL